MKHLSLAITLLLIIFACQKEVTVVTVQNDLEFDKAGSFFGQDNDSAFYYYNQVATQSKDSLLIGKAYSYMAVIQNDAGDYFGSIESALEALRFLDETNEKVKAFIVSNYNELGVNNLRLNNYNAALTYYDLAARYSENGEPRLVVLNNKAVVYQQKKDYSKAIKIYDEILNTKKLSKKEYARTLTNSSFAKWLQNPTYKASNELLTALNIREAENDLWGQNSSYAHLADYYSRKKPDSALFYARNMFAIAKKINSPGDKIEALQKLIKLSPADSAKHYFETYHQLSDSVQLAQSAAKNQFALIRYEVEKNKADNLRLEKENAEKQNRLVRQRAITGASIFLLLLVVGGGTLWYKRRKQRLELEAQNKVKETQLNLSKKVHDVVANDIYRVMTEVEYKDDLDREGLLDKLEVIYNQSRDISHNVELEPTIEIPYNEQVSTLLRSFATDHRRVSIAGNDAEQWTGISKRIKNEVKYVLQELMVNMKKHSQAEQVVVRFEKSHQQLKIFYKDNGLGIPKERSKGTGLANTVSRIENLGGEIIFASEPGKGLSITANIPLI
uniref:histidine kinase n=1 Tax=Sphingobacterium sp. (strain 21) TaxID=743722 RepID=F4C9S3_SPHS2